MSGNSRWLSKKLNSHQNNIICHCYFSNLLTFGISNALSTLIKIFTVVEQNIPCMFNRKCFSKIFANKNADTLFFTFPNVMLCTIWYHFYILKNVKNTYGRVLTLSFLHRCFSRFLKLYKWYQIARNVSYL